MYIVELMVSLPPLVKKVVHTRLCMFYMYIQHIDTIMTSDDANKVCYMMCQWNILYRATGLCFSIPV